MKCSFCGTEIQESSPVEEHGLYFCNPLHRYSFRESKGLTASTANPTTKSFVKSQINVPNDPGKKNSHDPSSRIGSSIGALVGVAASAYFGMSGFLPLVLTFLFLWLLNKVKSVSGNNRFAIAIQSAHFSWMAIGGAVIGSWGSVYLDLIILFIGLAWLLLRYSIIPVIVLSFYQSISIYGNSISLLQTEIGSMNFKALIVSIILRVLSLYFMIMAFIKYRKEGSPA